MFIYFIHIRLYVFLYYHVIYNFILNCTFNFIFKCILVLDVKNIQLKLFIDKRQSKAIAIHQSISKFQS